MEKEISDMFDLVATLLILCICMATGVSSAIRDDREVIGYEASYKDKTAEVKYTPSLKVYGNYDGTLTQGEVLLTMQLQDHGAMKEKRICVANKSYKMSVSDSENEGKMYEQEITTSYKTGASSNISEIWNVIKSDNADEAGYSYIYNPEKNQYVFQQVTN